MSVSSGSFIVLESVDSSNNYAMQKVYEGKVNNGDAWFAIEQTKGKGRRGKGWASNKGENIMLSIAFNTGFLRVYEQFQLSAAAALACYDLLKKYDNINTKIKWPNDLYWNDRKAGGILIENIITGTIWQWAVIGIGININQTSFDVEKYTPVSLKQITGQTFNVIELAKVLHAYVLKRVNELKTNNFIKMLEEYNSVLYKKDEKVKLKKQNISFETLIKSVSPQGLLQTSDTLERSFGFDEIEWVL